MANTNEISGDATEFNDIERAKSHGDATLPNHGSIAPPPNVSGMSTTGMQGPTNVGTELRPGLSRRETPPQDAPAEPSSMPGVTPGNIRNQLLLQLSGLVNEWIMANSNGDNHGQSSSQDRIIAWDRRWTETTSTRYDWDRIYKDVIEPNSYMGVPFPIPSQAGPSIVEPAASITAGQLETQVPFQQDIAEIHSSKPDASIPTQVVADPEANQTLLKEERHEVAPLKAPEIPMDPDLYFVKGNVVREQAFILMQVDADKRPHWWDATYISEVNLTMVRFSRGESPITEEILLGIHSRVFVDFDNTHNATTLDDLHFMDQKLGTL